MEEHEDGEHTDKCVRCEAGERRVKAGKEGGREREEES